MRTEKSELLRNQQLQNFYWKITTEEKSQKLRSLVSICILMMPQSPSHIGVSMRHAALFLHAAHAANR